MNINEVDLVFDDGDRQHRSGFFGRDALYLDAATFQQGRLSVSFEFSRTVFPTFGRDLPATLDIERPTYHAFLERNTFEEDHFARFKDTFGSAGYGFAWMADTQTDLFGFQRQERRLIVGFAVLPKVSPVRARFSAL